MVTVKKTIDIKASTEKLYEFISDPTNLPVIWPSLIENKDIEPLPNGGHTYRWEYNMAGMRFEGSSKDIEIVLNRRVVGKTEGGIESTISWELQPQDGGTHVIFKGEYTVPIPLIGKLAEAFIVKQNENEAEIILANLKARMEV